MNAMTIRARLTLVIVVVTGLISAVGVLFGVRVLEGQVRQAAIDERAAQFVDFGSFEEMLFESAIIDSVVIDGEIVAADALEGDAFIIDPFTADDVALISEVDQEMEMMDFATTLLRSLPDFDRALVEIGSADGEILVWSGFGRVLAVSATGERFIDSADEVGQAPVLPISDLFEIGVIPDVFEFEDGFFDEPQPEDLDLEFGVRTVQDVDLAFIAEVSDELDALAAIRSTLRNVVIALTALAGLATWLIAGRALRPVGAITDQVREISSGTLSERVPEPNSRDEVGVLARTMNTMLGRLENSDLRRRQFVSDASHELRTPVAVLRSEAEVARRAPESTTIDDFAAVVLGESKRLEGLVEDLLSLARGDESQLSTATKAIDVDEIMLAESARTRSLDVDMSAVSAGRVIGHEDDMQRVVAHLLDNAARHGSSAIAVGVQTNDSIVRIWVDDDGQGVSAADRERVFERFIRLDDARTRDAGGAGLGLAVVHETVVRMGGTIQVLEAPLGGARFQIELPAV